MVNNREFFFRNSLHTQAEVFYRSVLHKDNITLYMRNIITLYVHCYGITLAFNKDCLYLMTVGSSIFNILNLHDDPRLTFLFVESFLLEKHAFWL
jgi:hypothetical protein